ncbi:tripartite motif-containing protein 59-like isoform X1 [Asterias rubens]|uniref:tripartite motif-containing protein 59-like isoform X1 n=1 Tax=Asterias rubens TaxID=7604 RepID=UPI001455BE55|nr:tripartite motif-containing protein 59-like isoform X1 [Asterias rubens]
MEEVSGVPVLDNIRKAQLQCLICYSQYINPKTLTCEHSFCKNCLEEMMEAHPTKSISCPVCRRETSLPEAGIADLPKSFSLISLMETIAEQQRLVEHHGLNGQTVLDNISKAQLECPICYSQYINPKTLTCKHNFCQNCLEEMRTAHPLEENIICPICRKETSSPEVGIDDLPQSFFLINLIETIAEQQQLVRCLQTKINCQDCDEEDEAVSYCLDCQEFLCEVCDNAHQRSKRTKGHEKASIDHLRSGKASFKKNSQLLTNVPKCGKHTNQNKISIARLVP